MEEVKDDLDRRADAEHADDSTDSHRAAQEETDDQHNRFDGAADQAHRNLGQTLGESGHHRVTGSAAHTRSYIKEGAHCQHKQAQYHHAAACNGIGRCRYPVQPLEEVHHIAHRQGVAQSAEPDGFTQHNGGGEDTQSHQDIDGSIADAGDVLNPHVEYVPWGHTHAALDRQQNTYCTEEQSCIEPQESLYIGKDHGFFNLLSVCPDGQNH